MTGRMAGIQGVSPRRRPATRSR